jgi:hypothetical protein
VKEPHWKQGTTYPNTQALTVVVLLSFLGYLCCITPKEGKTSSGNVSVTDRGTTLGIFHHLGYFWRPDMIFCKDKVAQKKWQHFGLLFDWGIFLHFCQMGSSNT